MKNLQPFIERVLAKRQAQIPKLEASRRDLVELFKQLKRLREMAKETADFEEIPQELRKQAKTLGGKIQEIAQRFQEIAQKTDNLIALFGRKTINIGVAGKTGMGKSTFLQAISGLGNTIIPTSSGEPCTGAKSRILHFEGDAFATIEYYKETAFLKEIVHAYFEDLGLSPIPNTLADFAKPLPGKRTGELRPGYHAVYEKLEKVHRLLPRYRGLLSRPSERVELDKLRPLVSQDDGSYLAVRCAEVLTKFPNADVTGIGLIDLPGLGEIAKGHGEKLVTSLQQDVDAVLVIKRPTDGRALYDEEDYKVFDRIKEAVPELELSDWLFLVLNRDDKNSEQVKILKDKPPQVGASINLLAANCRDRQEVGEIVFLRVLNHLEENLERLDSRHIEALDATLSNLADEMAAVVRPIADYFEKDSINTGDHQKFGELFMEFLTRLRKRLDDLTEEYRALRDDSKVAERFRDVLNLACERARSTAPFPPPEILLNRFHHLGGWMAVLTEELHYLRSHLTHSLAEELNSRLSEMVDEVKEKVMAVLSTAPLEQILPADVRSETDPHRRLEAFVELLDPDREKMLVSGMEYLLSFTFSYQSHFHFKVRAEMDLLDPVNHRTKGNDNLVIFLAPLGHSRKDAEEVEKGLRTFFDRVVVNVRKRLEGELKDNLLKAIFSLVEETRDRLVRSRGIEQQWDSLIYPSREKIWPKEFHPFAVATSRRVEWQTGLGSARESIGKLRMNLSGR